MALYINDNGTLRTIGFLAVNDSGTLRRINEVYVNDNGTLAGPFTITHQTSRDTATSTSTISGVQETSFATTTVFNTTLDTCLLYTSDAADE